MGKSVLKTFLFLAGVILLFSCSCFKDDGTSLVTRVSGYSLGMDKTTGSVVFLGNKENRLSGNPEPLFRVRFLNPDGSFSVYEADDAGRCGFTKNSRSLTFEYLDFPDRDFRVAVSVKPDKNDGLFHFSMKVDTEDQIDWMEYPCVSVKETSSPDEGILWPYNEGAFFSDASKHAYIEPQYPSQGNYAMYPGMVLTPFLAQITHGGEFISGPTILPKTHVR